MDSDNIYRLKEIKKLRGWTMKRVRYDLYTFEKGNKKRGFHMNDELADKLGIIKNTKKYKKILYFCSFVSQSFVSQSFVSQPFVPQSFVLYASGR